MSESTSPKVGARTVILLLAVVALAAVGVILVRSNSTDSGRDRNIAGGAGVSLSTAPYQVALFSGTVDSFGRATGGGLACGGTIIASKWVLTADHCIWRDSSRRTYPDLMLIGSGESQYWSAINSFDLRTAVRLIPGRGVPEAWPNSDLMLIEVDRPFKFSTNVRAASLPIGLDNTTWPAESSTGLITGWGATLDNAARTELRGVNMKVNASVYSQYCTDDATPMRGYYWPSTFEPFKHLCLLRPNPATTASACSGDSGGPFVMTVGDKQILAGVASKAARDPNDLFSTSPIVCTGFTPNLYVRVASALDWIVPGQVTSLSSSNADGTVSLTWAQPTNPPAVPITDWVIEYRVSGATEWSVLNDGVSDQTGASITGLSNGQAVDVRVAGINAVNELDATMRTYATLSLTVGVESTTTTTSTTVVTTTTLPVLTTTIAPSTTARQVQIGARTTTTSAAAPATTTATPATTTGAAPVTTRPTSASTPQAAPPVTIAGEDPGFSQPKVTPPPGVTVPVGDLPAPAKPTTDRPAAVVGASLGALQVAALAKVSVPDGASVAVTVAKASSKVCQGLGGTVTFLAKGTCRATLSISTKPGSAKKKAIKLKVS